MCGLYLAAKPGCHHSDWQHAWWPGFDSRQGQGHGFLSSPLRHTQLHTKLVSGGAPSPDVKQEHSTSSSAQVKECMELYLYYPVCVVFNKVRGQLYLYLYFQAYKLSEQVMANFSLHNALVMLVVCCLLVVQKAWNGVCGLGFRPYHL
jgi:hypothetical protein